MVNHKPLILGKKPGEMKIKKLITIYCEHIGNQEHLRNSSVPGYR